MSTRYIAIEHNSGFIWGDVVAETPELACLAIDREADKASASTAWERVSPIRDSDGGYHLYKVPADFPQIEDGQDQDMIDMVWYKCQHIGDYRPISTEEIDQ